MGSRFCFCVDAQVALAVASKGRSSSKLLDRILKRLNAYVLETFTTPFYIYVHTTKNPSDGLSRLANTAGKKRKLPHGEA